MRAIVPQLSELCCVNLHVNAKDYFVQYIKFSSPIRVRSLISIGVRKSLLLSSRERMVSAA